MRSDLCFVVTLGILIGGCSTASTTSNPPASNPTSGRDASERHGSTEAGQGAAVRVVHGPVFQLPSGAEARALSVDARGVITAVHPALEDAPASLPREHLPGAWATAGLHDAHLHVVGIGMQRDRADLRGARSPAEVVARLQAFAAARPTTTVLYGRGWDQSLFAGQTFPAAADLEELGERPVVLTRVDGHALWVNNKALELAGIDGSTADPAGGSLHRDGVGTPTGVLIDNAMGLVRSHLPAPSDADLDRWLVEGLNACADVGLVAVHDMGMSQRAFDRLVALDRAQPLPVRVFIYLDSSEEGALARLQEGPRTGRRWRLQGLKLYADGAMGSRGAALLDAYSDAPGNRGLLITELPTLTRQVHDVHQAGGQVAIHAIGDRAVRTSLSAIETAQRADASHRHRVEHAQMLDPEDVGRFEQLGVVASMQPTHATSDMRWAEQRVGSTRVRGTYAWKTLVGRGAVLAFGSDAPVESHRPAWGLYASITRQDHRGQPPEGWYPSQRLTLEEALAAFSSGAAYAVHQEDRLGVIAAGAELDLTIWPSDHRDQPPLAWIEAVPTATVVAGSRPERLKVPNSKP